MPVFARRLTDSRRFKATDTRQRSMVWNLAPGMTVWRGVKDFVFFRRWRGIQPVRAVVMGRKCMSVQCTKILSLQIHCQILLTQMSLHAGIYGQVNLSS